MLKSILILEESLIVHQLFESALPHDICNWKVFHESESQNFITQAIGIKPDIIFLSNKDQKIGYPCLKSLREQAELQKVPIILLTTGKDQLDESFLVSMGVFGFIRKPFEASTLREQIEALFEDHRYANLQKHAKELDSVQVVDEDLLDIISGNSSTDITIDELETELDPTHHFVEIESEEDNNTLAETEIYETKDTELVADELLDSEKTLSENTDEESDLFTLDEEFTENDADTGNLEDNEEAETELIEVDDFEDDLETESQESEDDFLGDDFLEDSYELDHQSSSQVEKSNRSDEVLYEIPVKIKYTSLPHGTKNTFDSVDHNSYAILDVVGKDDEVEKIEDITIIPYNEGEGDSFEYQSDESDDLFDEEMQEIQVEGNEDELEGDFDEESLDLDMETEAFDISLESEEDAPPLSASLSQPDQGETPLPLFPIQDLPEASMEEAEQPQETSEPFDDTSNNFEVDFDDQGHEESDEFDLDLGDSQSPEDLSANIQQMISLRQVAKAKYDLTDESEVLEEESEGFEINFNEDNENIAVFPVDRDQESVESIEGSGSFSLDNKTSSPFPKYQAATADPNLPLFPIRDNETALDTSVVASLEKESVDKSKVFSFPAYEAPQDPKIPLFPIVGDASGAELNLKIPQKQEESVAFPSYTAPLEDPNLPLFPITAEKTDEMPSLFEDSDESAELSLEDEPDLLSETTDIDLLSDAEDLDLLAEIAEDDKNNLSSNEIEEEPSIDLLVEEDSEELIEEENSIFDEALSHNEEETELFDEVSLTNDLSVGEENLLIDEDLSDDENNPLIDEDLSDDEENLLIDEDLSDDENNLLIDEDLSDDEENLLIDENLSDDEENLLIDEDLSDDEENLLIDEDLSDDEENLLVDEDLSDDEENLLIDEDLSDDEENLLVDEDLSDDEESFQFPKYQAPAETFLPLFPLVSSSTADQADITFTSEKEQDAVDSFEEIDLTSPHDTQGSANENLASFSFEDASTANDTEEDLSIEIEESSVLDIDEPLEEGNDADLEEIDLLPGTDDSLMGEDLTLDDETPDQEEIEAPVLGSEMQMIEDTDDVVIEVSEDVFSMDDFSMKRVQEDEENTLSPTPEPPSQVLDENKEAEETVDQTLSEDYKHSLEDMIQGIISKSIKSTLNEVLPDMVDKIIHDDTEK